MGKYNVIKINENSIRQIVETCVKSILRENDMDEFRGGTIVYHEKNHMGTTGGKIQDIFPYNEYLIFQWAEDRGVAIKNDRETLKALRYGYPKCPEAALVGIENGGVRPIETGGFAVYQSSLHWDHEKGGYVYENKSLKKLINETHVYDELDEIHKRLNNIMNSGYIPFASPSPSSTELEIKNAIINAARSIDKAMYLDGQCYGSNPIAHVC